MPKIIFAVGGTGGHLFPAQALAEQLLLENKEMELLFAGEGLSKTAYFDKVKFSFCDISSTTPFRGTIFQAIKSIGILSKGIRESFKLLSTQKPDLVIGFGSFHAFPLLCAAAIKKIPMILFESNAIPGKVVRLFSKRAQFTALYFSVAKGYLKGKTIEVDIPIKNTLSRRFMPKEEAKAWLQLDPHLFTLLVFGGSQGARALNQHILQLLPQCKLPLQLIHFTGNDETAREVSRLCQTLGVRCYVKKFEPRMDIAWNAADLVLCRSGAMTLSELLHYEVPGILIPYPYASDQHQLKNAQFLEKTVGGAICFEESTLSSEILMDAIRSFSGSKDCVKLSSPTTISRLNLETAVRDGKVMQEAIKLFKVQQKKADFSKLVIEFLETQ